MMKKIIYDSYTSQPKDITDMVADRVIETDKDKLNFIENNEKYKKLLKKIRLNHDMIMDRLMFYGFSDNKNNFFMRNIIYIITAIALSRHGAINIELPIYNLENNFFYRKSIVRRRIFDIIIDKSRSPVSLIGTNTIMRSIVNCDFRDLIFGPTVREIPDYYYLNFDKLLEEMEDTNEYLESIIGSFKNYN